MTEDHPPISVITDISANIFAVFIVILIVLLALPHDEPPPAPLPKPIDAASDLVSVTRAPLSPAEMVDLLFARRRAADGVSVDLFRDRIVIARPGEPPEEISLPLHEQSMITASAMISAVAQAPIGLYVFDHGGYPAVLKLIDGKSFREISVPAALRGIVDQRQDWREGFRVLIDRAGDIGAFRTDLSRLLASPDPSQANTPRPVQSSGSPAVETRDPVPEGLAARLSLWLQRVPPWSAISLGVAMIVWVEWHRMKPHAGKRSQP